LFFSPEFQRADWALPYRAESASGVCRFWVLPAAVPATINRLVAIWDSTGPAHRPLAALNAKILAR
jgi:hypothetical protein